jgi:Holliday junction resolvase RusA-like endonuclease
MKIVVDMAWGKNLSVNHMRFGRGGKWHRKPEVQAWMDTLAWKVKIAAREQEFSLPLRVTVDFRWPDKRPRDCDNHFKVIQDSVAAGLGLVRGRRLLDEHLRIGTGSVTVDRANPGFTITVEDGEEQG